MPLSLALGEGRAVMNGFATSSLIALAYLVIVGSLIGYSAYVWLLHHVDAAKVSSHAYVNPLVAVLVGAGLAGEKIYATTVIAAGLILISVFFIVRKPKVAAATPENAQPSPRPRIAA